MSTAKKRLILLGGYEAKTCPEKIRKKYDPKYKDIEKDPTPSGEVFRMLSGIAFEEKIGLLWSKLLPKEILSIPKRTEENSLEREELTLSTMKKPGKIKVIWNARLPQLHDINKVGEPDALVLYGKNKLGYQWIAVDVKDHKSFSTGEGKKDYQTSELMDPFKTSAEVVEYEKAGLLQIKDALQLAHYYRMLQALNLATDEPMGGIIGREEKIIWHKLDNAIYRHSERGILMSPLDYYDTEFAIRLKIAQSAVKGVAEVGPQWHGDCGSCEFRTTCLDELKEVDHITLLPGITPSVAKKFYVHGVEKVSQVARLHHTTAHLADRLPLIDLITKASLLPQSDEISTHLNEEDASIFSEFGLKTIKDLLKLDQTTALFSSNYPKGLVDLIDQARVFRAGKVYLARGNSHVNLPRAAVEEDIDIEDDNGFVYLIGVRTTKRRKKGDSYTEEAKYHSFYTWDRTPESEADVFARFWSHIQESRSTALAMKKSYKSYHFHEHERTAFVKLAERNVGHPGVPTVSEVKEYINSDDFLDLHKILTSQLIWPTMAKTLKDMAKWVRFSWRDSDPGGGNSLAWYDKAVNSNDNDELEENRSRLLDYNADDVEAQIFIRNWLSRLGEARQPGSKLPNVTKLEQRFSPKL